ncbi:MAG: DUF4249 domain-containing protein [Bacteroidales bacterium]|nr:DUF4249 domain-containing protein [Bacteroidales bacterium]
MSDRIYKIFFTLGLTLILVWGCTEKINIELIEADRKLVIEGTITNEIKAHEVRLTKSSGYYDNERPEPVQGAKVTIQDFNNMYELVEVLPGIYQTFPDVRGDPGSTYTLIVEVENEKYIAVSKMPWTPLLDSIKFYEDDIDPNVIYIGLFAPENPIPGNNYYFNVYKDDILLSNDLTKRTYVNDDLINGRYLFGLKVHTIKAQLGNRITLEVGSISKEYFKYCLAIIRETAYADSPFEAAPGNINGNISNGAFGYFSAHSIVRKTKIYQRKE